MPGLPRIIVFASGTKIGGGTGFEKLAEATKNGILDAEIVAVVSNWESGGVYEKAQRLCIPFEHLKAPFAADKYATLLKKYRSEWVVLSGWLKLVPVTNLEEGIDGLDPKRTINIHPGPLPRFGGPGMYGQNVHKAVHDAFIRGEINETGPTIHFVTEKYDEGPCIFRKTTMIDASDTPSSIAEKVKQLEDFYFPRVTQLVVNGKIYWDGKYAASLVVPDEYEWL